MLPRRYPIIAVSAAVFATLAIACGPDFSQLLTNRRHELLAPVVGNFYFDAARLAVTPKQKYPVDSELRSNLTETRFVAESAGLSGLQMQQLADMRKAENGDAAYAQGQGLPEAIRLYSAGAVDFHLGGGATAACPEDSDAGDLCIPDDSQTSTRMAALERAIGRFQAVLALPPAERKARATWAAFSLGRALGQSSVDPKGTRANHFFAMTRRLADEANPDPLRLAVASYGEQARMHLKAGELPQAVELYAEQAAHGSSSGIQSLRIVAEKCISDLTLLRKHITVPIVQRLLIAYVLAYGDDGYAALSGLASDPGIANRSFERKYEKYGYRLQVLTAALEAAGINRPPDADRLAAAAYASGRFELAAKYAGSAETILGHWIKAKLALRAGNKKAAAAHFAQAIRPLEGKDRTAANLPADALRRAFAERAMLTLASADFRLALEHLYGEAGTYWMDMAYLAERVMTTDELKAFVDARVPEAALAKVETQGKQQFAVSDPGVEWPATSPAAQLRDLLARRLMRETRYAEAYPYFHAAGDIRFRDQEARAHAKQYADALAAASRAWTQVGRAQSLYEAAVIARRYGMDIFGYELEPDYFVTAGNLEFLSPRPEAGPFVAKQEVSRYQATRPAVDKRFHYRYLATDLASRAADALPPRSEAYAAVLCNATSWLIHRDPSEAEKSYRRYVKHGALVEWGASFGERCPEPGFQRTRLFNLKQQVRRLRAWGRHHKLHALGVAAMFGLAVAAVVFKRRRKAANQAAAA